MKYCLSLLLLLSFLHASAQSAAYTLEDLRLITFDPIAQGSFFNRGAYVERGIKGVIQKIQNKQQLDTTVLVRNSKLQKDTHVRVYSGVPVSADKKTIFIYSPGWLLGFKGKTVRSDGFHKDVIINLQGGVGAHLVYRYMRFGMLNGTTVTFDYPTDSLNKVNGGQVPDVEILRSVYDAVAAYNPEADIVLLGDCKGGTTILNLITHPVYGKNMLQLKGVLVESPPLSLQHIAHNIAAQWLWWLPGSASLIAYLFKSYTPQAKNPEKGHLVTRALKENMPTQVPIFLGRIVPDDIASADDVQKIADHFRTAGNDNVHVFSTPAWVKDEQGNDVKLMHARLGKLLAYQRAVNQFFKQYGFPYDADLAGL